MRPINRITPQLPAQAFKTYQVVAPLATHFRPATCAEVDCPPYLHGWSTTIDRVIDLDGRLEQTVRASGRRFVERREEGRITFVFEPGQPCFKASAHRVPLERDPLYVVRDGDWRGNPRRTSPRQHQRAQDWVDDFAEHQARLNNAIERG